MKKLTTILFGLCVLIPLSVKLHAQDGFYEMALTDRQMSDQVYAQIENANEPTP
jgi:hypothetical protein